MRKSKILALLTTLCVIFAMLASTGLAAVANGAPGTLGSTLYVFDLKTFLGKLPSSVAQYDYFKLATALQGLANRDRPQIYMLYESTSINAQQNFDVDSFWLDELSKEGKYLSDTVLDYDRYPPTSDGFFELMSDFSGFYNGFVVWDHNVPASANAASTAAGVEDLLPVRYYPDDAFSLYNALFVGDPAKYDMGEIKLDLNGKFTGEPGLIWDSNTESTGSAKNDAYLWAKEKYLDAGLTNPLRMAYCIDAWVKPADTTDCEFLSVCLPDTMYPGETVRVRITVKNNTASTWREDGGIGTGYYRLGTIDGNMFHLSNFDFGGYEDGGSYRAFIGGTVSPGASYTYEFDITAPMEEGVARIVLQMVQDGVRWMPGIYSKVITVTSDSIPHDGQIPPEQPAGANEIVYPMMFWTTLANADYHIAQKAFFWDLSPDERIAPIDDRGQAVGEDVRTLNKILFAQAQQSGFNIFNVSGFVPWNFKYTSTSDPGVSSMGDVDSEWTMINRISSYGGQTEADANAGVGDVSNCSVFMHVPLNDELKQNNDKGRSDTRTRVSGRHYFTIYMGDYDSGSWTSSILSMLWANSKDDRGKYPLSWPIPTGISGRIPQLFNYLYDNATQNDFFVAGNNGTAYLNSSMFEPNLRPSGMPDMLETWENYNIAMNRRFDIDVLGFHINTSTSTLSNAIPTQRVFESIARMAPVGASVQSQTNVMVESGSILNRTYSPRLITNASNGAVTPVINYRDIGGAGTTAQELANNIYNIINTNNGSARTQNFHSFRCILIPPSVINEALDLLASGTITGVSQSTARSRLNYEVVDPYTMYRLAGQKWGEQTVSFDSNGGSDVDSIGATTRDLIYDIPADPTKEDHAFLGWYANEALTTPWDFAKDTIWEDITLYAKWKISDAGFLEERAAEILKNGLTKEQLILSANNNATLTLVINGREFIIALGVNNRNVSGSVELADGSGTLVFDIRGNGSNVVIFKIVR